MDVKFSKVNSSKHPWPNSLLVKIILMHTMQARSYMIEKMCVFVWGGGGGGGRGSIINS